MSHRGPDGRFPPALCAGSRSKAAPPMPVIRPALRIGLITKADVWRGRYFVDALL